MTLTHPATPAEALPFAALTATALALVAVIAAWAVADPRLIADVPVWAKPAKFAISFALHFATLAVIVRAMSPGARTARGVQIAAMATSAAFASEMAYLIFQAAQAQASHFNFSTRFHTIMYSAMGVGALVLIAMPLVVAHAAVRDTASGLGPATRAGIWWGAIVSAVLTLLVAGYMSANLGHLVGIPAENAAVFPIFGWSAAVGDLRPAHFLSLHALQVLPLAGLWLDRRGYSARVVLRLAVLWSLLTLAVFGQALLGLPLIRL